MTLKVLPSLLAVFDREGADEARLIAASALAEQAGATALHIDVMAPPFVPRTTFSGALAPALRGAGVNIPLDVHLMGPCVPHISEWVDAGAARLSFHAKMCASADEVHQMLAYVQGAGVLAGIALDDDEPIEALQAPVEAGLCDYVMLMTVKAGAGGQPLQPQLLARCAALMRLYPRLPVVVDGGANLATLEAIIASGADEVVMGSALFNAPQGFEAAWQNVHEFLAKS